jgi:tRNA nucleotidyltransferase (CCA-adding enzyme)
MIALLRRYQIRPYRYRGQRYTTVMARVPKRIVSEVLWPEFEQLSQTLEAFLTEVTDRVIAQSIDSDTAEVEVAPGQIPPATGASHGLE